MLWTKPQRNEIYRILLEKGIDPSECRFTITDDRACIVHSSGSFFRVEPLPKSRPDEPRIFGVISAVKDGPNRLSTTPIPLYSIIEPIIIEWASAIAAPDLWAEMQRSRELIADIGQPDFGNAPFTQDEQRQIATQLEGVKTQLKEQKEQLYGKP